jgi:hypothetical protein
MITPLPSGTEDSATLGPLGVVAADFDVLPLGALLDATALGEPGALVAGVPLAVDPLLHAARTAVPPPARVTRPAAWSRVRRRARAAGRCADNAPGSRSARWVGSVTDRPFVGGAGSSRLNRSSL